MVSVIASSLKVCYSCDSDDSNICFSKHDKQQISELEEELFSEVLEDLDSNGINDDDDDDDDTATINYDIVDTKDSYDAYFDGKNRSQNNCIINSNKYGIKFDDDNHSVDILFKHDTTNGKAVVATTMFTKNKHGINASSTSNKNNKSEIIDDDVDKVMEILAEITNDENDGGDYFDFSDLTWSSPSSYKLQPSCPMNLNHHHHHHHSPPPTTEEIATEVLPSWLNNQLASYYDASPSSTHILRQETMLLHS